MEEKDNNLYFTLNEIMNSNTRYIHIYMNASKVILDIAQTCKMMYESPV